MQVGPALYNLYDRYPVFFYALYKKNEFCEQSLIRRLVITHGISMWYRRFEPNRSQMHLCWPRLPATPSFPMLHAKMHYRAVSEGKNTSLPDFRGDSVEGKNCRHIPTLWTALHR